MSTRVLSEWPFSSNSCCKKLVNSLTCPNSHGSLMQMLPLGSPLSPVLHNSVHSSLSVDDNQVTSNISCSLKFISNLRRTQACQRLMVTTKALPVESIELTKQVPLETYLLSVRLCPPSFYDKLIDWNFTGSVTWRGPCCEEPSSPLWPYRLSSLAGMLWDLLTCSPTVDELQPELIRGCDEKEGGVT